MDYEFLNSSKLPGYICNNIINENDINLRWCLHTRWAGTLIVDCINCDDLYSCDEFLYTCCGYHKDKPHATSYNI